VREVVGGIKVIQDESLATKIGSQHGKDGGTEREQEIIGNRGKVVGGRNWR
jgi:hypothetical protein